MSLEKIKEYIDSLPEGCTEVGITITQRNCSGGNNGTSGTSGISGTGGGATCTSGTSGTFGMGVSGTSGSSGKDGTSGTIFVNTGTGGGGSYNEISTQEQFDAAFTSTGEFVLLPNVYTVSENKELPYNIKFVLKKGVSIAVANNFTFTISGRFVADDNYQVFTGAGKVSFTPGSVYYISPIWFGANPHDPAVDDTVAFEKTIDAAQRIQRVFLPPHKANSHYTVSKTITFYSPQSVFSGWEVFGLQAKPAAMYLDEFTQIKGTHKVGPIINFRGQRLANVHDFSISGVNTKPFEMANVPKSGTLDVWNALNWASEGVSTDRYDHNSAIGIDYVGGAGEAKPWSAQMFINNISISDVYVGISVSPNRGMQADTIWVTGFKFENIGYAIAVNQDQCRTVKFKDGLINSCFNAFNNDWFGKGNGSAFSAENVQVTGAFKIFEITNAYRGNCHFSEIFAEGCGVFGSIVGLGNAGNAAIFTGCEFGFDDDSYINGGDSWLTPWANMVIWTTTTFNGCNFKARKKNIGISVSGKNGKVAFNGCSFPENKVMVAGGLVYEKRVSFTNTATETTWNPDELVRVDVGETEKNIRMAARFLEKQKTNGVFNYYEMGFINIIDSDYETNWGAMGELQKPDQGGKVIVVNQPNNRARVGDYGAIMSGDTHSITGYNLGYSGLQFPGLQVIAVDGDNIKLQRLSPEVDLAKWCNWGGSYRAHEYKYVI